MRRELIQKWDTYGMGKIIYELPEQLRKGKELTRSLSLNFSSAEISSVLITGLGGSAIAGDILKGYLRGKFSCNIEVNRSYHLPAWVKKDTLVFAISYSGNTEETLSSFSEALERGAKIVSITSNGELAKLSRENNLPLISLPPGYPPRGALGYLFSSLLYTFRELGWWKEEEEMERTIELLEGMREELSPDREGNFAEEIALKIKDRIPLIYSTEDHLSGVAMRWKTQLNENAKIPAYYALFPELDHNEIMGWEGVEDSPFILILLRDTGEEERMVKRIDYTLEVLRDKISGFVEVNSRGESLLERMLSLIYIGDWVSFYTAILRGFNPTEIKSIDRLKALMRGS